MTAAARVRVGADARGDDSRRWSWIRERRAVEAGITVDFVDSQIPEAVARVGALHLVIDDHIRTNIGPGTNQDVVIVFPETGCG